MKTRKRSRRVVSPKTIAYYKNLFKKHLKGKVLSEELVEYVVNYENKWQNVFSHYIQHLHYLRRILPKTCGG